MCDLLVGVPVAGEASSLNVTVAAGALLYEALRQRSGQTLGSVSEDGHLLAGRHTIA